MPTNMKSSRKPSFTIGNHDFYMPKQDINGKYILRKTYPKIEAELKPIIDALEEIVGKDNIEVVTDSTSRTGKLIFTYKHNKYKELQEQIKDTPFRKTFSPKKLTRFDLLQIGPEYNRLFTLNFEKDKLIVNTVCLSLMNLHESEKGGIGAYARAEKYKGMKGPEFIAVLTKARSNIDSLLAAEQVTINTQNRVNFYSLLDSSFMFRLGNIPKITGVSKREHSQFNPNLAKAAGEGLNADLLLIFYLNNYYPKNSEEIKELSSLPYSWLNSALSGD